MLTLVQVIVAPVLEPFPHVVDLISLFLMDVYGIPPEQAVRRQWRALLQHQLTSLAFGKHYAHFEVIDAMVAAALLNQLVDLKKLFQYNPFIKFSNEDTKRHPFERAAAQGNLQIVEWMGHYHRHHCTQQAMIWAALNGKEAVVRWLCDQKLTANAQDAAEEAAEKGFRAIVELLVAAQVVTCVKCVMDKALESGDMALVTCLDANESNTSECEAESHLVDSVDNVNATVNHATGLALVEKGGVALFAWLADRFKEMPFDKEFLVVASRVGALEVVQWLYDRSFAGDMGLALRALEAACGAGRLDVVQFFVGHGVVPGSLDAAVTSGNVELVKFLQQEFGNRVGYCHESAAVLQAIGEGHVDMVRYLSPNFTTTSVDCNTSLAFHASMKGSLDMIQFLFGHELTPSECFHALRTAIRCGHMDIVKFVYSEVKRMNWWGHDLLTFRHLMDALDEIARKHDFEAVTFLLDREDPGEADFGSLVGTAIHARSVEVVKLLDEKKVNGFHGMLLADAARSGSLRMVRFLYESGRDRKSTSKGMEYACARGYLHIVNYLHTSCHATCTAQAMNQAARNGHVQVVKFLHFNRQEGCTADAVRLAAKEGHLEVVQFLLTHRQEGNAQVALAMACRSPNVALVQWLVECLGQQVDERMFRDAAACGCLESVQFLHSQLFNPRGLEVKVQGIKSGGRKLFHGRSGKVAGREALSLAAKGGHLAVVQFLLAQGNENHVQDALNLAEENGHHEIVHWIVKNYPME